VSKRPNWAAELDSSSNSLRTLALHRSDSTQIAQISPFYGSFSMDRVGWSLIPNLLLISHVLILDYMLDSSACRLMGVDYIYLCDLSIN